jgi:hypothetical protein
MGGRDGARGYEGRLLCDHRCAIPQNYAKVFQKVFVAIHEKCGENVVIGSKSGNKTL